MEKYMDTELETWVNEGRGTMVIRRAGPTGARTDEAISGGQMFKLAPFEREMNHTACRPHLDPFLDGTFTCLEGGDKVPKSPNHLTKDELHVLLTGNHKAAEKRLAEVTSVALLDRIYDAAKDSSATPARVKMIEARLDEVHPDRIQVNASNRAGSTGISDAPPPQAASFYDMSPQESTTAGLVPGRSKRR